LALHDYFFHRAELRGMALEELEVGGRVRIETLATKLNRERPRQRGVTFDVR
jgi:hypothetical protein